MSSNGEITSSPFGSNKYFAVLMNVVNLQFVAKVRAEVV